MDFLQTNFKINLNFASTKLTNIYIILTQSGDMDKEKSINHKMT